MNPSDSSEERKSINFDDFLARESLENGSEEAAGGSPVSSFSDSFDMMPVYRSLDVMSRDDFHQESLSGVDMVFEPPAVLATRRQAVVTAPPPLWQQPAVFSEDLFSQLEADFTNTCMPRQSDQLCGISQTSVVVAIGISELITSLSAYLEERGIHHEHCEESSLWKCEMTNFVDTCKFRIQVYCSEKENVEEDGVTEYTVEFLRVSGSSLLFSMQFQGFKSAHSQPSIVEIEKIDEDPVVRVDMSQLRCVDLTQSQQALEAFVAWASADQAEATRAVCGLLAGQSTHSLTSQDQLSPEGIIVMTLLGTLCVQHKSSAPNYPTSSLPMLSLLHQLLRTRAENDLHITTCAVLTTLIDSLIPATARLTANSHVSACEREVAVQMMEANMR